jgi:hypothetical protein
MIRQVLCLLQPREEKDESGKLKDDWWGKRSTWKYGRQDPARMVRRLRGRECTPFASDVCCSGPAPQHDGHPWLVLAPEDEAAAVHALRRAADRTVFLRLKERPEYVAREVRGVGRALPRHASARAEPRTSREPCPMSSAWPGPCKPRITELIAAGARPWVCDNRAAIKIAAARSSTTRPTRTIFKIWPHLGNGSVAEVYRCRRLAPAPNVGPDKPDKSAGAWCCRARNHRRLFAVVGCAGRCPSCGDPAAYWP